ncbi:MAG TPA: hypothetical protein VFI17_03535 [Solirubrobacterales bacterium]|nr:hypothetical protein [Solirubrobacterales bacterium]
MTSYVYPFASGATTGRIDQGQDFGGTGPIYAIGNARITSLGAPGWPGGRGILYQLLDGSRRGQYVFVYEGVRPSVRVGQVVGAGQRIGSLIPGSSTGIEIGFADANGVPLSHSEYTEGKETVRGKEMARFLAHLKAGGGKTDYGGGPIGFAKQFVFGDPLEALGIGSGQGLKQDILGVGGQAASTVGAQVVEYIGGLLGEKAAPILLTIALVVGGAFLIYFGLARAVGVAQPVATPLRAVRAGAIAGAAA